jgi:hypothetical protein
MNTIRPIHILVTDPHYPQAMRLRVWAVDLGDGLAIHPSTYCSAANYRFCRFEYTITHIASGMAYKTGLDRRQLLDHLKAVRELTWRNIPIQTMHACEIITNASLIAEEIGPGLTGGVDMLAMRYAADLLCGHVGQEETAVS